MKSFVVSSCLLLVFIVLTSINCIRVEKILGNILDSLYELSESQAGVIPDYAEVKAEAILSYWKQNRSFLSLTVNNAELRDCESALCELSGYSAADNVADYNTALSKAKIHISDLSQRESVSPANIF